MLPADGADSHRLKPWLLHTLPVNTLNFCAFTMCYQRRGVASLSTASDEPIYIAVPGRDDKKAEVYQFPDEQLICAVPSINTSETGEPAHVIARCLLKSMSWRPSHRRPIMLVHSRQITIRG